MGSLSIWHWLIVLGIVLIVFGPGKLPEVFKQAGKGVRAFKNASEGRDGEDDDLDPDEEEELRREIRKRKAKRKQLAAKDELDDEEPAPTKKKAGAEDE